MANIVLKHINTMCACNYYKTIKTSEKKNGNGYDTN